MTRLSLAAPLALACFIAVTPAHAKQCVRFLPSGAYAIVSTNGPCKTASRRQEVARAERRGFRVHHRRVHRHHARLRPVAFEDAAEGDPLVSEARRYLGTNPTGWARVWCGKFLADVVRALGGRLPRNPNLARDWAALPRTSPRVGAIAVMPHHVGIVAGFDRRGNPILVSGNHNRRVGEGVYPRSRIIAYVSAS